MSQLSTLIAPRFSPHLVGRWLPLLYSYHPRRTSFLHSPVLPALKCPVSNLSTSEQAIRSVISPHSSCSCPPSQSFWPAHSHPLTPLLLCTSLAFSLGPTHELPLFIEFNNCSVLTTSNTSCTVVTLPSTFALAPSPSPD